MDRDRLASRVLLGDPQTQTRSDSEPAAFASPSGTAVLLMRQIFGVWIRYCSDCSALLKTPFTGKFNLSLAAVLCRTGCTSRCFLFRRRFFFSLSPISGEPAKDVKLAVSVDFHSPIVSTAV